MKINLSNDMASSFYNTMSSIFLMPVITRQTRITGTSCRLIDNVFESKIGNVKSGIPFISSRDIYNKQSKR